MKSNLKHKSCFDLHKLLTIEVLKMGNGDFESKGKNPT